MNRRRKSALLWGAVGAMSFLVLIQGYALARGPLLSITEGAAVALGVGVVTSIVAYTLEHRIAEWTATRATEENA